MSSPPYTSHPKTWLGSWQVLGIHLGIRHLLNDELYTAQAFKDAADAVHREDVKWASQTTDYSILENCPKVLESIWKWEL